MNNTQQNAPLPTQVGQGIDPTLLQQFAQFFDPSAFQPNRHKVWEDLQFLTQMLDFLMD